MPQIQPPSALPTAPTWLEPSVLTWTAGAAPYLSSLLLPFSPLSVPNTGVRKSFKNLSRTTPLLCSDPPVVPHFPQSQSSLMAQGLARSTPLLDPSALLPPFQPGPRRFNQPGKLEPPQAGGGARTQGPRRPRGRSRMTRSAGAYRWKGW